MLPTEGTLIAGTAVGGYVVERLLGRGGMGEVYLAHDPVERRRVALKLLPSAAAGDPTHQRRLHFEGRVAQALRHPNICSVYEVGQDGDRVFLAIEYVEGRSLPDFAMTERPDVQKVVAVASQIAAALEHARQRHIVHCDLKGSNIIVTPTGQVKVLDFGLARLVRAAGSQLIRLVAPQTEPGIAMGTTEFMSPEQVLGRSIDHRSDLFSLGVVLYELLTGRMPFAGGTRTELLQSILSAEPPSISQLNPDVPAPLDRIVAKLLSKDAANRYQTAAELIADLRTIRRRPRASARPGRSLTRSLRTAAALLIAVCGLYASASALSQSNVAALLASAERPSSVWAGDTTPDGLRPVVPAAAAPAAVWVGNDGQLFYVTRYGTGSQSLWAVAPGSRGTTLVAQDVSEVTVTRGRTVFFVARGVRPGLYRSAIDGSGAAMVTDGVIAHPVATRDGKMVMFGRRRDGAYSVWAVPADGGPSFQISSLKTVTPPYVSPNGRRIAFQDRAGVVACDLPACGNRVLLPIDDLLGWTADSEALAHAGPPEAANVWVIRVKDGAPHQVTRFTDRSVSGVAWSPNGQRFAVARVATLADLDVWRLLR